MAKQLQQGLTKADLDGLDAKNEKRGFLERLEGMALIVEVRRLQDELAVRDSVIKDNKDQITALQEELRNQDCDRKAAYASGHNDGYMAGQMEGCQGDVQAEEIKQ